MTVYALRQICEPGVVKLGRRVNCLSDSEALALAQRIAAAGLSLEVWREDELIQTITPGQSVATLEPVLPVMIESDYPRLNPF